MKEVKKDDTIKVHYKGKLNDGSVFDSSEGKEPLSFKVGSGTVIPGFEEAVVGMKEGDKKTVEIASDNAYGPVREDLIQKVPKSALPESITPEIGMQLVSTQPDGSQIPLIVVEMSEEEITVDANHQLAGKDLVFDLELVEIG